MTTFQSDLTLDEALDRFDAEPNGATARQLRVVASEYHADDMISDGEFASIMSRTAKDIVGVQVQP
jgi:hypothetical protein